MSGNLDSQNEVLEKHKTWAQATGPIRKSILEMITEAKSGHPGGSLSLVEILYTLFARDGVCGFNEQNITDTDRDRLVLSKGHGVPALYAVMAHLGLEISKDELLSLRSLGSRLQGHPDRVRIPFLEASTGSLGQGASIAQGMAQAYRLDHKKGRVFTIVGDGEIQEGQVWEMALSAAHYKLDNLTLIVDYNKGQIDGPTKDVLNLDPLADKWRAFGWEVVEVDGHYYPDLEEALRRKPVGKPYAVIAHTVKGRGVSFMEYEIGWHGKAPTRDQLTQALGEVEQDQTIGLTRAQKL